MAYQCINSCCRFEETATGSPGIDTFVYNYCGGGCGVNRSEGGGTPINPTDTCCLHHDNCLVDGVKDSCTCHDELLSCLEGKNDPGTDVIAEGIGQGKKRIDNCY